MPEINLPGEPDLSSMDRISWDELHHAYGSAMDVPGQLRAVLDPDSEKRRRTFYSFTCNLFHQGSVYPATVPAIGVLQQLLRYRDVPDKAKILETLLIFAVGCADQFRDQVDVAEFVAARADNGGSDSANADLVARECYLAVGAGAPLYTALLQDSAPDIAAAAAFVMAFFPAHAFAARPHLRAVFENVSHHEYVCSSALMAWSYLASEDQDSCPETVCRLIEAVSEDTVTPVSLLSATAACVVLARPHISRESSLQSLARRVADRCLAHGVLLPDCDFYSFTGTGSDHDSVPDAQALLMPDIRFPWGDPVLRIQRLTGSKSTVRAAGPKRKPPFQPSAALPEPDSFQVKEDSFDPQNISNAVRRYHAHFIGDRPKDCRGDKRVPAVSALCTAGMGDNSGTAG